MKVALLYVFLILGVLLGVGAYTEVDDQRAGIMVMMCVISSFGFIGAYCIFYFG